MAKKKIGNFWSKRTKTGEEYWTGVLNNGVGGDVPVILFHNGKKEEEKQPDLCLYISERREQVESNIPF